MALTGLACSPQCLALSLSHSGGFEGGSGTSLLLPRATSFQPSPPRQPPSTARVTSVPPPLHCVAQIFPQNFLKDSHSPFYLPCSCAAFSPPPATLSLNPSSSCRRHPAWSAALGLGSPIWFPQLRHVRVALWCSVQRSHPIAAQSAGRTAGPCPQPCLLSLPGEDSRRCLCAGR